MARKRRNRPKEYGKVVFTPDGVPIAFEPIHGVPYRLRELGDCERLHDLGEMSDEDFRRCKAAFERRATS